MCEPARPPGRGVRRVLAGSILSSLLSLGAGYLPPWRWEPRPVPAAVLMVGEPTRGLAYGAAGMSG